jgi:hypothetical protein
MDTNIIAGRFMDLLRERIDTETGQAIILKLIETMDAESASAIADECEDFVRYREYLSEDEASRVVRNFVNFDGSRGGHWDEADELFKALDALGIRYEKDDEYNRWAFFTVMNMVWSDEWGVLRNYANPEQEARVCAELAVARLEDADEGFSVRRYFRV